MSVVVLLNGAFGVGKSTVARLISRQSPGTGVFDPERIGFVLQRLPCALPGSGKRLDDYQDSALWRRLTVAIGSLRARCSERVLMPMMLARRDYIAEITAGFERAGVETRQVCLTAGEEVVAERLRARGLDPDSTVGRWVYPRAARAAKLHRAGGFGATIATDALTAEEVAARVLAHLDSIA